MVRRKGLEYVIDGFTKFVKHHSQFSLILAGGTIKGQEQSFKEIKTYIKRKKMDRYIKIKGFLDENKQDELYQKAYAVVIPAKVSMGSSGPLYHAQSYGKCILTSNIGHFKEDIVQMKDGILVDNDQWSEIFSFVVEHPEIVNEIENNVIIKSQKKGIGNISKKYLSVYQTLLNET